MNSLQVWVRDQLKWQGKTKLSIRRQFWNLERFSWLRISTTIVPVFLKKISQVRVKQESRKKLQKRKQTFILPKHSKKIKFRMTWTKNKQSLGSPASRSWSPDSKPSRIDGPRLSLVTQVMRTPQTKPMTRIMHSWNKKNIENFYLLSTLSFTSQTLTRNAWKSSMNRGNRNKLRRQRQSLPQNITLNPIIQMQMQ